MALVSHYGLLALQYYKGLDMLQRNWHRSTRGVRSPISFLSHGHFLARPVSADAQGRSPDNNLTVTVALAVFSLTPHLIAATLASAVSRSHLRVLTQQHRPPTHPPVHSTLAMRAHCTQPL
jgi:hypothetical protein